MQVTYSSKPVRRNDEFALITSHTELTVHVVLTTLDTYIQTDRQTYRQRDRQTDTSHTELSIHVVLTTLDIYTYNNGTPTIKVNHEIIQALMG